MTSPGRRAATNRARVAKPKPKPKPKPKRRPDGITVRDLDDYERGYLTPVARGGGMGARCHFGLRIRIDRQAGGSVDVGIKDIRRIHKLTGELIARFESKAGI